MIGQDAKTTGRKDKSVSAEPYVICELNDIPSRRAVGVNLMRLDGDNGPVPWPIIIVRWGKQVFGYVNRCPHNNVNLDWERDQFLDPNGVRIMCGKHGALFDIGTGECVGGPCVGEGLEPVALVVLDGDICVLGVALAEDDPPEVEIEM